MSSFKMIHVWFFMLSLCSCSAVIYHLNDTEYQRMPPLFSLDEYESCLVEEGSTYCLLQLELYAEPGNELISMITEYSDQTYKHYNHNIIDKGVCVKRTCQNYISNSKTTKDPTGALEACLNDSLQTEYGLNARVSRLYYCDQHNEPRHIDAWDWTVLLLIFGLVMMNIIGSSYDYIVSKQSEQALESGNTTLLSFSVMRNWKHLTNTDTCDPRVRDLKFLHGFRVTLNMSTILVHALMSYTIGFTENSHEVEKSYEIPIYKSLYSGMSIVQIFFFISGFLLVYHLRSEERKHTFTVWDIPKIMLRKFCRLVPVLGVTLALSTTWVRHAGSGPLWNLFVTGSMVADCRKYWWRHLFFYHNYSDESKFCLLQTWQLAAEMQLFIVSVTAYIVTRGRARRVLLAGLLVLGAAAPALYTFLQDLDAVFTTPQSFRTLNAGGTFWIQQAPGHTNFPCFIMGMATAARLYDLQQKGHHYVQSRWYSLGQYLSVAAFPVVLYSGSVFFMDGPPVPLLARVSYSLCLRTVLGLACTALLTSYFMKSTSYIKSMLESPHWVVPSRLTYCVYLLHMVLVNMIMGARTNLSYFSFFNVVSTQLFVIVVSYVIAVPFNLMVESPFIMLFKSLAKKQTRSTSGKNGSSVVKKVSAGNGTSDHGTSDINDTSNVQGNGKKFL